MKEVTAFGMYAGPKLNFVKTHIIALKVLGKSVGGENAKVPRYEVKW